MRLASRYFNLFPLAEAMSCGFGHDGDKFIAKLFGLAFDFCFQSFLPLAVSGGPDGFVIFDLVLDYGVKDQGNLVGGSHGCSFGTQLGFHSAQVVAEWRRAMVEGKSCQAE